MIDKDYEIMTSTELRYEKIWLETYHPEKVWLISRIKKLIEKREGEDIQECIKHLRKSVNKLSKKKHHNVPHAG